MFSTSDVELSLLRLLFGIFFKKSHKKKQYFLSPNIVIFARATESRIGVFNVYSLLADTLLCAATSPTSLSRTSSRISCTRIGRMSTLKSYSCTGALSKKPFSVLVCPCRFVLIHFQSNCQRPAQICRYPFRRSSFNVPNYQLDLVIQVG